MTFENCQPKDSDKFENCQPKPARCGCGGEAEVIKHTFHGASPSYGVECTNCHTESWQFYNTEAEAIEAWNKVVGGNVQDCAKNARCSDPDDLISRRDAIDAMMALKQEDDESYGCEIPEGFDGQRAVEALEKLPSAEPERKWIPITLRELTEEERKVHPDWDFGFACQLPCDEEIVLLTDGTYIWEDTFHCDDGCYFERADDIEDWEGYAWMPMPKPYKGK